MTGLLTMTILVLLIGLLALRFGADTRDGRDWHRQPGQWRPPHRPAHRSGASPVVTLRVVPNPDRGSMRPAEAGSSRPRSVGGAA